MLAEVDAVLAVGDPIRDASCWPIDVRCRDAAGSSLVVRVKPINTRQIAAAAVAEAIAWHVLRACGLHVAEPFIVRMTAKFAEDLTAQGEYDPPIRAGRHWGTRFLIGTGLDRNVTEDELSEANPDHVFRIYLVDELTGNRDRLNDGNLLLVTDPVLPSRLVAIDQSDCFGGKACCCDPACLAAKVGERYAKNYPVMESLLLRKPPEYVDSEFRTVAAQRAAILASVNTPHAEWYDTAGVTPGSMEAYLRARVDQLPVLAQRDRWKGICALGQQYEGKLPLL